MKKAALFIFIVLLTPALWAQNRHALIIGNAAYPRAEDRLPNTINDTDDISGHLRELGFNVDLKQNLQRLDMVREINAFMTRLRSNRNSEGFLWYAGHAMEINGEIFLFPLDVNVENDELIRATSFSVTDLTRQFGEARNRVNVIVLDACRVPPSDGRSRGYGDTSRVIRTVPLTPPDLYVMYSTAPGTVALDGTGKRNSPFAEAFLKNIRSTEPLTIMAGHVTSDTMNLTGNRQRPYTSGSMGRDNVYYSLNASGGRPLPDPNPGPSPALSQNTAVNNSFVLINGGTFTMGSPASETGRNDSEMQHRVTVSSFYMGRYEVTQADYEEVMGANPSQAKGFNLPVTHVSWFDAAEYCNRLSRREGLTPAYTISGNRDSRAVTWNRNASGYRLPTEAEWEYACRAGTTTAYNTGAAINDNTGWHGTNSGDRMRPVGEKPANAWGLHDMHGNVWEWCWDWYGTYGTANQTDPEGASLGVGRVSRGGSWSASAARLRSAYRNSYTPAYRYGNLGFRLARSIN